MIDESETLISERDIPRLLGEYQIYAVSCILNNQLQQAKDILIRSTELIQAAVSQDAIVSTELVILIEHTFAYYYNNASDTMSEVSSLLKTLSIFKKYSKSLPKSFFAKPSNRILKARILLKLHLQLLAAFSKLDAHNEALNQAKQAIRRSSSIIHNSVKACQDHLKRHKALCSLNVRTPQVKNQQYSLMESPHYLLFHNLVLKAIPILLYLDEKTNTAPKVTMPNLFNCTLEDFTKIEPMQLESLAKGPEIMEELERDLMAEKILTHVAVHYFLANLLKKNKAEESLIEGKILLKRAWKMTKAFLPSDSFIFIAIEKAKEGSRSVSRIRSNNKIKTPGRMVKHEFRSASTNKFRTPSKRLTETCKDMSKAESSLVPLRRKVIGKFKKIALK